MSGPNGSRIMVAVVLGLVLVMAGMLAVDGWRRSQAPRAGVPAGKPANVVEVPAAPAHPQTPAPAEKAPAASSGTKLLNV